MEEMQKAFNKTIIKLQNTSRMAEEQVSKINNFISLIFSSVMYWVVVGYGMGYTEYTLEGMLLS